MTKDELFKAVQEEYCLQGAFIPSLEKIIAPHLAIPRSLKDDKPKSGQKIIVISSEGNLASGPVLFDPYHRYANTHWIPFPDLPQPDKDEQEFEEWNKTCWNGLQDRYERDREVWMAARGRK